MKNKYIKLYTEMFSLDDEVKKTALEDLTELSDDIKVFNSRKNSLKNLIMNNIDTNKDITNNIDAIVNNNRFLKVYLGILNNMSSLEQTKKHIEDLHNKISDKKNDISDASTIDDSSEKNKKIRELNSDVVDINKKIKEKSDKISELNRSILKNENELKKTLKIEQDKLVNSLRDLKK